MGLLCNNGGGLKLDLGCFRISLCSFPCDKLRSLELVFGFDRPNGKTKGQREGSSLFLGFIFFFQQVKIKMNPRKSEEPSLCPLVLPLGRSKPKTSSRLRSLSQGKEQREILKHPKSSFKPPPLLHNKPIKTITKNTFSKYQVLFVV
jgi:hypothetical protein